MLKVWIVVGHSMDARIYSNRADGLQLKQIRRLDNPGTQIFGANSAPAPYWVRRFARDLSALLEMAAAATEYDELMLAAPADFLQALSDEIGPATRQRLRRSISEDLTQLGPLDLEKRLLQIMGLGATAPAAELAVNSRQTSRN